MTYLAIASGGLDDLPLAICKTYDEARTVARYALTNPKFSIPLQHALKVCPGDLSHLCTASVVVHGDDGVIVAWDNVWGAVEGEGEVEL